MWRVANCSIPRQSFKPKYFLHFGEGAVNSIPTCYCFSAFKKTNTNHNYEHPCALEEEKKNTVHGGLTPASSSAPAQLLARHHPQRDGGEHRESRSEETNGSR